ncbi:MAG TPA: PQQ-dependent sugar dehydrogenase, partial [Candidatus Saccharimonadales bacterium]|nr:PQQ-dependent sugar dehydrogenase [Candidatus Saccharimonadales bacterium]
NADGSVPSDNPFPGSPVYSLGHRNPQGLAWHPATGELWSTEHGQSAADEVNIIKPGANYGWPRVQGAQSDPAYTSPVSQSGTATWAPSGAAFYGSPTSFFFTGLRSQTIWQLTLNNDNRSAKGLEARLQNQFGRLRDVTLGPDGFLYLITNNRDGRGDPVAADDRIIRVKF